MKSYGKKIASVSMVLVMMLSGISAIASVSSAAPAEETSKIEIEDLTWDRAEQGFVVALSLKFGIATAGEHADFSLGTTLEFDAGGNSVTLSGESAIVKVDGATKDSDNMITIDPTFIPWDRNGGKFEGLVDVSVKVIIEKQTPNDNQGGFEPVGRPTNFDIHIPPPPDCDSDSDCDDGNECTYDTCQPEGCFNVSLPDETCCDDGDGICIDGICVTLPPQPTD
jgi:hypothetical protein